MSDDWADEVAEAPPAELAPVLPELPQIMLFGELASFKPNVHFPKEY